MPRKPLSDRESAICCRLKLWRESQRLTRPAVAEEIGLTADSYANYEYERAPLRYGLVCNLVEAFPLNPLWLATGEGPQDVRVSLPPPEDIGVSPRALFSEVFDRALTEMMEQEVHRSLNRPLSLLRGARLPRHVPINERTRPAIERSILQEVHACVHRLPDSEIVNFSNRILEFTAKFLARVFPHNPEDELKHTALKKLLSEAANSLDKFELAARKSRHP